MVGERRLGFLAGPCMALVEGLQDEFSEMYRSGQSGQEVPNFLRSPRMKSVLYYYNAAEGEEEIHEDEEVEKLVTGDTIERNGEYWRIVDIVKRVAAIEADADTIDLDVVRVYLAGPQL
jgi:hypothetical protein